MLLQMLAYVLERCSWNCRHHSSRRRSQKTVAPSCNTCAIALHCETRLARTTDRSCRHLPSGTLKTVSNWSDRPPLPATTPEVWEIQASRNELINKSPGASLHGVPGHERGRPNRTRLASAGIFAYGPEGDNWPSQKFVPRASHITCTPRRWEAWPDVTSRQCSWRV
jgi:hypothetical protein